MSIQSKEIESLFGAIEDLIEIKILLRKTTPTHIMDDNSIKEFKNILEKIAFKLQPIFQTYLHIEPKKSEDQWEIVKELLEKDTIIIISANSSKKRLKELGFDARRILVSGGPILYQDYELINPNINDERRDQIRNKCEHFLSDLKQKSINTDIYFICESQNKTDRIILDEIKEISSLINKQIEVIHITSWKQLIT